MMTMNGSTSRLAPCSQSGNQLRADSHVVVNVCNMPITSPPASARGMEDKRPMSAAPNGATISVENLTGFNAPVMEPTRMPASPAVRAETIQLVSASRSGEYPRRIAPFSLPAAARVARPNFVKRYSSQRPRPSAMTNQVNQNASLAKGLPSPRKLLNRSFGKTSRGWGLSVPKFFSTMPCRYNIIPSEPMTLPSGAALRSGRNTRKWAITPNSTAISRPSPSDGMKPKDRVPSGPLLPMVMFTGMLRLRVGRMSTHGSTNVPLRRSE